MTDFPDNWKMAEIQNDYIAALQRYKEFSQRTTIRPHAESNAIYNDDEVSKDAISIAVSRRRHECLKEVGRLESTFDEAFKVQHSVIRVNSFLVWL